MFQVTAHIVGFRLVLVFRVVNEVLVAVLVYSILMCIQIPCIIHTAKTGLLRCCLLEKDWRRCLFLSSVRGIPVLAKFEHGSIIYREEEPRKDSGTAWPQIVVKLFFTSHSRSLRRISDRPSFQDHVEPADDFAEYKNHVGSCHDLHFIARSGFVACGQDAKKGKQTVFHLKSAHSGRRSST